MSCRLLELRDALGCHNHGNLGDAHRGCDRASFGDALGGQARVELSNALGGRATGGLMMHLEAEIM
jgi:hypothetical protein